VRATGAALAVVSCGAGNRFGFPDAAVVERWSDAGAIVSRLDREGAVTVAACPDGRELCARSFFDGEVRVRVP